MPIKDFGKQLITRKEKSDHLLNTTLDNVCGEHKLLLPAYGVLLGTILFVDRAKVGGVFPCSVTEYSVQRQNLLCTAADAATSAAGYSQADNTSKDDHDENP